MDWKEECEKWKQIAEEREKEIERLERSHKYDREEYRAEIKKYNYGGFLGCFFAVLFTGFLVSVNIERSIWDIILEMLGGVIIAVFSYVVFFAFQHMSMNETAKRNFWIVVGVMAGAYVFFSIVV
nr:hypothetical protein [uncultured Christensenella sp.]